jgi:lipopolysaccharide export LptBFGC system permease protein LptF
MLTRPTLKVAAVFAVLLVFLVGAVAVQSQQRRRRAPSRRVTNPVSPSYVPAPSPTAAGEPRLVSTAEETAAQEDPAAARRERRNRQTPAEQQQQQDAATRRALEQISNEVTQLNKKVETMERERRVDVLQERLTRAEQRVEG